MARKEAAAIKKYSLLLPEELSKRYGGVGPYTETQVTRTVNDLGLNKNFIQYAFLMYCEQEVLTSQGVEKETIASMLAILNKAGDDMVPSSITTFLGDVGSGNESGGSGGG